MSFSFNGIRKDYITLLTGDSFPAWAPRKPRILSIPAMPGGHLERVDIPPLSLSLPVLIEGADISDLQKVKEDLADWLVTDEPKELIRDIEPDRVYFAIIEDTFDPEEIVRFGRGTINFICPDPYKYGPELEAVFPGDVVSLTYDGTEVGDPVFELEVTQPTTFAMVQNQDDEYMMIGRPTSIEQIPFTRKQLILHDTCSTTTGWTNATAVDNGYITGAMVSENGAFKASLFGSAVEPYKWQGPSMKRSIGQVLQNFQIDIEVEIQNVGKEVGMIEVYLLDASNNIVAKVGVEDVWRDMERVQTKFQLGNLDNRYQYYRQADKPSAWNNFKGILRISREGQQIQPYFSLVRPDGKHDWVSSAFIYMDTENKYQAPITQVQVAFRVHAPTINPAIMRIDDIKVWKINNLPDSIPYIADVGDIITFDHSKSELLINGEDRTDIKDFGGQYFKLKKGSNQLVVYPGNSFNTSVRYRERFK